MLLSYDKFLGCFGTAPDKKDGGISGSDLLCIVNLRFYAVAFGIEKQHKDKYKTNGDQCACNDQDCGDQVELAFAF